MQIFIRPEGPNWYLLLGYKYTLTFSILRYIFAHSRQSVFTPMDWLISTFYSNSNTRCMSLIIKIISVVIRISKLNANMQSIHRCLCVCAVRITRIVTDCNSDQCLRKIILLKNQVVQFSTPQGFFLDVH